MQPRLNRLKRMAALYGVVERMHSTELRRATSILREAELAIEGQRAIVRAVEFDGREALISGDRMDWSFAETQREIAAERGARLEQIRLSRETLSAAARERYTASRVKSEQMNRVVERDTWRVEMEEGRRVQIMTDERFLSRKLWMETREARLESK
ncbi:MAG TPA: hypothetical protein VIX42_05695 [Edaphobacter sp.]